MSGTESESHQAGQEARRDTVGHVTQSGSTSRYDALLRYLRGLYVRGDNAKTEPKKQGEAGEQPTTEAKTNR